MHVAVGRDGGEVVARAALRALVAAHARQRVEEVQHHTEVPAPVAVLGAVAGLEQTAAETLQ